MAEKPADEQAIFEIARKLDSAEARETYLQQICGQDLALEQRVKALLRAYDEGESFLESPPAELGAPPTIDQPITEKPGSRIGPYKLLQQIGEGGFGVVYMAEQTEPVERRVAIKIIKPGMDTRQVIARFEAERQALAMMDHPNIAKVLDAGATESGRPYFVMELVKGTPITEYCDQQHLTPAERLRLFMPVCQAAQHAHQKGIIHRDLKPSNVLVAEYDDNAVPKIIDFGVAKALSQRLTEKTMFTEYGQVLGTLEYMSPEQARVNQLDVDTRSDIYALGVMLYELLTGTTPFDKRRLRAAAFDECLQILRDEEPPRPSLRLSTVDTLPTVAANRQTEPQKLGTLLRGDLDWIVMKALEKDRTRRYETANGLAADIERYLKDEPVVACPPSAAYRFKKFARRNKGPLTIATASALLVVAIAVGASIAAARFRSLAEKNAALVVEKDVALSKAMDAEREATQASDKATAAAKREKGLRLEADRQRSRAEGNVQVALQALDQVYLRLAEEQVPGELHIQPEDEKFLKEVLPFYERLSEQEASDPDTRFARALAYRRVGIIYYHFEQRETTNEAIPTFRRSAKLFEELVKDFPDSVQYRSNLANTYRWLGIALRHSSGRRKQQSGEALEALRRSIAIYKTIVDEVPSCRHELLNAYGNLTKLLTHVLKRPKEAEVASRAALALAEELAAEAPDDNVSLRARIGWVLRLLATALRHQSRAHEAEQTAKRSVDLLSASLEQSPDDVGLRANLGSSLRTYGDLLRARRSDTATDVYQRAIELLKIDEKNTHPYMLGQAYFGLFAVLRRQGKLPEAEANLRMSVDVHQRLAADYPGNSDYHLKLAGARLSLARLLKARGLTEQATENFWETVNDTSRDIQLNPTAFIHIMRAECYQELGQVDKARDDLRAAAVLLKQVEINAGRDFIALNNLAWFLTTSPHPELHDAARALQLAEIAAELAPNAGFITNTLGVAYYRAGNWNAAVEALTKSMELDQGASLGFDAFFLAMAHWRLGEHEQARQWYDKAATWMDSNMSDNEHLVRFRQEAAELLGVDVTTVPEPKQESADKELQDKQDDSDLP